MMQADNKAIEWEDSIVLAIVDSPSKDEVTQAGYVRSDGEGAGSGDNADGVAEGEMNT
jgi:hypothetical protein